MTVPLEGPRIRQLCAVDAPQLAALHFQAFDTFFLTSLGESFLRRFYGSLLARPWGLDVGIVGPDGCAGFAVGSLRHHGFYRDLVRTDGLTLLYATVPVFARHPGRLLRVARSVSDPSYQAEPSDAVLCSICVAPSRQGMGTGSSVLREFERRAYDSGRRAVVLTTDAYNNASANRFYTKNGYELIRTTTTTRGRRLHYYRKSVSSLDHSPAPTVHTIVGMNG